MSVSGEGSDESHHLPAVEDWPRGYGEASWWPFVAALGASGIYLAAGLVVLGQGTDPIVSPVLGPAVLIASVVAFVGGLYGWTYHAFVSHFWSRETTGSVGRFRWGMLLFLGSEVGTFSAGFVYYFFIRAGQWPPGELPHLLTSLVLVNTAILVVSSVTLHFAHVSIRNGNHRRFRRLLAVTVALGFVFLGGQAWEYYEFIINEGYSLSSGVYFSAFFGLTGLHGLHVGLGAVLLGMVLVRALAGQYSADRHVSVTTISMYWHFVDAVWIFLVVTLYVGAAI